jgi:hypothetical protein
MKNFYDAIVRTIFALVLYELVSSQFIKLANSDLKARTFDLLIFTTPVFISMLLFNIIKPK